MPHFSCAHLFRKKDQQKPLLRPPKNHRNRANCRASWHFPEITLLYIAIQYHILEFSARKNGFNRSRSINLLHLALKFHLGKPVPPLRLKREYMKIGHPFAIEKTSFFRGTFYKRQKYPRSDLCLNCARVVVGHDDALAYAGLFQESGDLLPMGSVSDIWNFAC